MKILLWTILMLCFDVVVWVWTPHTSVLLQVLMTVVMVALFLFYLLRLLDEYARDRH